MTLQAHVTGQPAAASQGWYARSPAEVTAALEVDPAAGLTAARAAEELGKYIARRRLHRT